MDQPLRKELMSCPVLADRLCRELLEAGLH